MNRYTKIHDFDAARASSVGSSDISTLAGLNVHYDPRPYEVIATGLVEKLRQTPYTLYREKRGEIRRIFHGGRLEWGHRLEPVILSKWIGDHTQIDAVDYLTAALRGRSLGPLKTLTECRAPDRPYVLAHADLLVHSPGGIMYRLDDSGPWLPALELGAIVEAKSSGCYAAKRKEREIFTGYDLEDRSYQGIPDAVYLQVQWQMLAYDVPVAYVVVLIDTGDYREYGPIPAAPRIQERCLALAERFMACLAEGKPPKPETWTDVASMWPEPVPLTAMVSGEDEMRAREYVARLAAIGDTMRKLGEERDELLSALGIYMGENAILTTAEGTKLATSSYTARASVTALGDMTKAQKAILAGKPEALRLYNALDVEKTAVSARVKEIVEEVGKDKELWAALAREELIGKGFRSIRAVKIKEE